MESAASPVYDTNKFEGTHQTHFSLIEHMTDKVMVRFFYYTKTDWESYTLFPSEKELLCKKVIWISSMAAWKTWS